MSKAARPVVTSTALAMLAIASAGCADDKAAEPVRTGGAIEQDVTDESREGSRPRMGPEDIPEEFKAPSQQGDGTAQSFSQFLALENMDAATRYRPLPPDIEGLTAESAIVTRGEVVDVSLEEGLERLEGLPDAMGLIDLVVRVRTTEAVKGAAPGAEITWRRSLYAGDTVLVDASLERMRAELGPGPVGREILVFGSRYGGRSDMGVIDGLIHDETGTFRLAPAGMVPYTDYLTDIPTAFEEAAAASLE